MPSAKPRASASKPVLVVDIGGNNVKLLATGQTVPRRFPSGPELTPSRMVEGVLEATRDWAFELVSLGYPGPVGDDRPTVEPHNLGAGWVGFDFAAAFGRPVRILNDAAMQALGSYQGGRMLFLGLGTGLGSAMVINGQVAPLELAHLPYRKGGTYEDYVGQRGRQRLGDRKWRRHIERVVEILRGGLQPHDVVLGGGNVKKIAELPPNVRRGGNEAAFLGGFRMWDPTAGMS